MSLASIKCEYMQTCAIPGVLVDLGDGDCEPLPAVVCAKCAAEARRDGFKVTPITGEAKLTTVAKAAWRSLALHTEIPRSRYVELTIMPREWDNHGCKVFAAYFGDSLSFKVIHSSTYGCPAGAK